MLPALESLSGVREDVAGLVLGAVRGERSVRDTAGVLARRARTAARYEELVGTLGRELWGSATYAGGVRARTSSCCDEDVRSEGISSVVHLTRC